ncbi:MAG: acetate kinase [Nitrospirales bacterium]|nr:MAG: acetate kinase [Nitrospirales bacterium]
MGIRNLHQHDSSRRRGRSYEELSTVDRGKIVKILVVNCGSSSLKFSVHDMACSGQKVELWDGHQLLNGKIAGLGGEAHCLLIDDQGETRKFSRQISDSRAAIQWMCEILQNHQQPYGFWENIEAVGHRVVHGGEAFRQAVCLNDDVLHQIEQLNDLAPLHNPFGVVGIRMLQQALGKAMPMVAVFDTAFHATLPVHARNYALPLELAKKTGIRRYGFHGIAHASLARGYARFTGQALQQSRLITLQLGNGCSMAAISQGQSVETSMGFTPLEGLVMGTRSGNVDPAVVWHLMKHHSMSVVEVEKLLNEQSGLLGVSGRSSDMQVLLRAANEEHDTRAQLAIDMFCYRIQQYLGAYLAVLHGADAIVFGGGIGEHSPEIRAQVCAGMEWCGLQIDSVRNEQAINLKPGDAAKITGDESSIAAYVVATDEETLIAQETIRCLEQSKA